MSFAERNGFVKPKPIQVDGIDAGLRNRLYNEIHRFGKLSPDTELAFVVDRLGCRVHETEHRNWNIIDIYLGGSIEGIPWYMPYEIIELFIAAKRKQCKNCSCRCSGDNPGCAVQSSINVIQNNINNILSEEKSGYRLISGKFVNIISETELTTIDQASNSPYNSVNTHIKKALSLYADRKQPDYENSIKESISAVEAMCCIITGMTGASATLGAALRKLEDNGVVIHGALREAFSKMYGYASDADGIRHGGIDFTNAPAEDAKYMLISCAAFVNYLIEKHSKIGGT